MAQTHIQLGTRGTNSHPPWFCVAGVDPHPFHVAGVAQTRIHRRFAWQACQLWHTFVLRGRRGTYVTRWRAWSGFVACDAAALCVAGVALGDIHLHFTWQAWHKLTSTFVLRGRRGTYVTRWRAWSGFVACDAAALCVAGVAFGDIHTHFTWQASHKLTSNFVLRGRRGTYGIGWRAWSGFVARDAAALCVAGVAFGDIHLHFTHPSSFCVAGVALMALGGAFGPDSSPVTPRLCAWQACYLVTSTFISRGRRGTNSHPPSFCMAGVALMAYLRFAWQACHLWDWVARLVRICRL